MCDCSKVMIEEKIPIENPFCKGNIIDSCTYHIEYDRGYIRFVDAGDKGCLDHGENFKVNFCPMCGEKVD